MKCPHCLENFHSGKPDEHPLGEDADGDWVVVTHMCPACKRFIIVLKEIKLFQNRGGEEVWSEISEVLLKPRGVNRRPCPKEVDNSQVKDDYAEACLVLSDSPKASAALGRRCLQHVLREKAGVKKGNLFDEIQEVLDSGKVPSHISDAIDAVRHIGNFATHPINSLGISIK